MALDDLFRSIVCVSYGCELCLDLNFMLMVIGIKKKSNEEEKWNGVVLMREEFNEDLMGLRWVFNNELTKGSLCPPFLNGEGLLLDF